MKIALPLALLLVSACAHHETAPAEVPPATEIIKDDRLVPVPCSEVVNLIDVDSDGLTTSEEIEIKTFKLTRSDAQHRRNMAALEAAALKCGVKVNHAK